MDKTGLKRQLKALIVSSLNLEGKDPESIEDHAALFGDGGGQANGPARPSLGLDSLDALELAMAVEERFAVRIPETDEARQVFASVEALADYVSKHAADASVAPAADVAPPRAS